MDGQERVYPDHQGPATQWQRDNITRLAADLGLAQMMELIAIEAGLHGSEEEAEICERARKALDAEALGAINRPLAQTST